VTGQSVFLGQEEKKMINELIKLSTHLDDKGYYREANYVDEMIRKESGAEYTIPFPIELTHEYGRRQGKIPGHPTTCDGQGGLLSYYNLEHLDQMTKKVILNKIKKYKPGSSKGDNIISLMETIEAKNPNKKWALDPHVDYPMYYDVFKSLMLSIPLYAYNDPESDALAFFRGPPWKGRSENKRENWKAPNKSWIGECVGIYYNAGHDFWTDPGDYMPTIEHEVEHAITGAIFVAYGFNRLTSQSGKLRRLLPDPPGDIEMKEVSRGFRRAVHDEQLPEMHVELMGLSKFLVENNLGTNSEPFNRKIVKALCPTVPYDASDPMMLKILIGLYGGHIDESGEWKSPAGDDPKGFFEDDHWGGDIQERLENAACNNDLNQMLEDFNTLALAPAAEQTGAPEGVGAVYSSGVINNLIKLSTHLDNEGYYREANYVDEMIRKEAASMGALKRVVDSVDWPGKLEALQKRFDEIYDEEIYNEDLNELEEIETMCEQHGPASEACREADILFAELEEEWGEGLEEDYEEDYGVDQNARFVSSSSQNYSDGNYRGSCYYQGSDGVYFTVEFTGPGDEARPSCGGRGSPDPIPDGKVTYHD